MALDDFDQEDERPTRTTRRNVPQTERLARNDDDFSEQTGPLRQDWRSSRTARRPRRSTALPSSRQEFALWLQHGGWRIVAIAAAVVFVVILALVLNRRARELPNNSTADNALPTAGLSTGVEPTAGVDSSLGNVSPTGVPTAAQGAQFRVNGTETQGLFLRSDASTDATILATLPEGTLVTVIGEDKPGPNYTWKNVRAPDGTEGWAAADFLQPAQ